MATRNFNLQGLDAEISLLAGDVDSSPTVPLGSSQAACVVEVSLAAMRDVFKFTMDGHDVDDNDVDKQFKVSASTFATAMLDGSGCGLLGNANMKYTGTDGNGDAIGVVGQVGGFQTPYLDSQQETALDSGILVPFADNTVLLKYDMVRDVSAKAFGAQFNAYPANNLTPPTTIIAADHTDMFINEALMRKSAHDLVNALVSSGSIYTALDNANDMTSVTSATSPNDKTNIGRRLLQQILAITSASGEQRTGSFAADNAVSGYPGTYHMPLIEGDTLSFNLLQDNSLQVGLSSNVTPIDRTIRCVLVCKASPTNVVAANDDKPL